MRWVHCMVVLPRGVVSHVRSVLRWVHCMVVLQRGLAHLRKPRGELEEMQGGGTIGEGKPL